MWADAGIDPNNASMVIQMRPLWHKMLWHQVQRFDIEVSFGKRVVEYFEDPDRGIAGVVTDHGERAEADVVLAADGVNSRSQDIIMPGGNKGKRSGRSVYRSTYPLEMAMVDPLVKEYFGPRDGKYPDVQAWLGPDTHLVALCYFDKDGNNGQMVWGITFFEKGEQTTKESWHQTVSSEDVVKTLRETPGWGEIPGPAAYRGRGARIVRSGHRSIGSFLTTVPKGLLPLWPRSLHLMKRHAAVLSGA